MPARLSADSTYRHSHHMKRYHALNLALNSDVTAVNTMGGHQSQTRQRKKSVMSRPEDSGWMDQCFRTIAMTLSESSKHGYPSPVRSARMQVQELTLTDEALEVHIICRR
jgi:predicted KAP-like P-loop ATPase